jgi:hypothetical protein
MATFASLAMLMASAAAARGGYHHARSTGAPCGVAAGGLPDPGEIQRCLAARFKPPKPKPSAAPAPSNAATPSTSPRD